MRQTRQLKRGKLHTENGKRVIYAQHDKPSDPKQLSKWLPAPEVGFQFAARLASGKIIEPEFKVKHQRKNGEHRWKNQNYFLRWG